MMKIEGISSRINQNGRIVIPAIIRKSLGLKCGDTVTLSLKDDVLEVQALRARPRKPQNVAGKSARASSPPSAHPESVQHGDSPGNEWLG